MEQIKELFLHDTGQAYSVADGKGGYQPARNEAGYRELDSETLRRHLAGELTISVQPIQIGTGLVRFAAADFDGTGTDHAALEEALKPALRFGRAARAMGLRPYLGFSGRRGWHVYIFFEDPIPAWAARAALKCVVRESGLEVKEIYPAGDRADDSYYPRPLKLPYGRHQEGGWAGIVDLRHLWQDDGRPALANPSDFLPRVRVTPAARILRLLPRSDEAPRPNHRSGGNDAAALQGLSGPPPCIERLKIAGVPAELEYNKANMTLARYAIARGMTREQAVALAVEVARSTKEHPSSKDTVGKRIRNFVSAWLSMIRRPADYPWRCRYVRISPTLRQECQRCPLFDPDREPDGDTKELGALLRAPFDAVESALMLPPQAWASPLSEIVLRAAAEARDDGELTSEAVLARLGPTMRDRAAALLNRALEAADDPAAVQRALETLRRRAARTAAVEALEDALEAARSSGSGGRHARAVLAEALAVADALEGRQVLEPLSKALADYLAGLAGPPPEVPVSMGGLEQVLGGVLRLGWLYAVHSPFDKAAEVLCHQIAEGAARAGTYVLLVTPIGTDGFSEESLARAAGIDAATLRERAWRRLKSAVEAERVEKLIADAAKRYAEEVASRIIICTPQTWDGTADPAALISMLRTLEGLGPLPIAVVVASRSNHAPHTLRVIARQTRAVVITLATDLAGTAEKHDARLELRPQQSGAMHLCFTAASRTASANVRWEAAFPRLSPAAPGATK